MILSRIGCSRISRADPRDLDELDYAKESWSKVTTMINRNPDFDDRRALPPRRWTRDTNGEQEGWSKEVYEGTGADRRLIRDVARYKIAASNEEGGRSLTMAGWCSTNYVSITRTRRTVRRSRRRSRARMRRCGRCRTPATIGPWCSTTNATPR